MSVLWLLILLTRDIGVLAIETNLKSTGGSIIVAALKAKACRPWTPSFNCNTNQLL